jgi:hypothetical protein
MQTWSLQKVFENYPDLYGGTLTALSWGGQSGSYQFYAYNTLMQGLTFDGAFSQAPSSKNAGYFKDWLIHGSCPGSGTCLNSSPISFWGANGIENDRAALGFLHNWPNVADFDYTTQPHQLGLFTSSSPTCASLTGWPCNQIRGDTMISRTGWTSLSDSLLFADFRTFAGDYDAPNGSVRFYKAGPLLGPDAPNIGGLWGADPSILSDDYLFAGAQSSWTNEFLNAPIATRNTLLAWGGQANSGSWATSYGDSQSRYAYMCENVAPEYNTASLIITVNYADICVGHFKPSGGDEIIVDLRDSYIGGAGTSVSTRLHYTQTGSQTYNVAGQNMTMGTTICVNPAGTQIACSGLTTGDYIESKESGGEYSGNAPTQQYGLMTWITSPGTITLNWDCPGSGNAPQCTASPLNTYSGGLGYSDRVTIAAGSSVGATVIGEQTWLTVHKVMQNLTDTTLNDCVTAGNTPKQFTPNSSWLGVQVGGASSCAVYMQGLNNSTYSSMPSFTTTHPGTAQYLLAGLAAGTYAVTVNGAPVAGSPFTVAANDTTIYFNSTAGVVSLGQPGPPGASTITSGSSKTAGQVIIH